MAATIPETEPEEIIAGETVKWTKSLTDYPATEGWTLKYRLRGTTSYDVTATSSGSDYAVTIAASTTANYAAGDYRMFAWVEKVGERYNLFDLPLTVKPDPIASSAYDPRTPAKRVLDAIDATLLGTASREEQGYSINAPGGSGRQINFFNRADLIQFRQYYQRIVDSEEAAENLNRGKATGSKILTRFV